jgi:hypothetical protein
MNTKLYNRIKQYIANTTKVRITKNSDFFCIASDVFTISWNEGRFKFSFRDKNIIDHLNIWQYWVIRIKCSLLWNKVYQQHLENEAELLWSKYEQETRS